MTIDYIEILNKYDPVKSFLSRKKRKLVEGLEQWTRQDMRLREV